DYAYVHQELKRKGVTLQLLWEEYHAAQGERAYRYSQFCWHYQRFHDSLARSMRQTHRAGEKLFIDYSGATMAVINVVTGEILRAQIFIASMGASKYTYAEATWTQQLPDWIASHVRMFEHLGCVPEILTPDCLKSAIKKAAVKLLGKGNKYRVCPLWPETLQALEPFARDRPEQARVFLNRRNESLTRSGIYKLVQRTAARAAGGQPSIKSKRIGPHCLRHSCATHLLRQGVDINTIRGWLGHVSIDTTNVYAEVDLQMKAKALAKCDVPGNANIKRWRKDPGVVTFLKSL
ncbi:MAG: tyrosine-type recombinase/integrase, partial [Steroidobacteraceae bacterium]